MRGLTQTLLTYFGAHSIQHRDAHERDRAVQRAWITIGISILTMWASYTTSHRSLVLLSTSYLSAFYAAASLVYLRSIQARPAGQVLAQYLFIVLDPALTVLALVAAPTVLAPLNPLLMVQIVRCGLRFGSRTMWLAWGATVLMCAALFPSSDFWMAEEQLMRSFVAMLAITPILFGPLIARLHQVTGELTAAATSDPLTGLGNRRMLSEHLRFAQARAQRDNSMLALLAVDLDNFKAVNDTLGHSTGDHLLEVVASSIKRGCRAGDFLARTGGDEFVLLAEGLSAKDGSSQAAQIAAKVISTVESAAAHACPTIKVTASVGVHCWIHDDRANAATESDLLDLADRAMYKAKRAGKARFVFAAP
jgi:diguanylate cyclase (GGDEF)-like protein